MRTNVSATLPCSPLLDCIERTFVAVEDDDDVGGIFIEGFIFEFALIFDVDGMLANGERGRISVEGQYLLPKMPSAIRRLF